MVTDLEQKVLGILGPVALEGVNEYVDTLASPSTSPTPVPSTSKSTQEDTSTEHTQSSEIVFLPTVEYTDIEDNTLKKKKSSTKSFQERLLEIEERKLELMQQQNNIQENIAGSLIELKEMLKHYLG